MNKMLNIKQMKFAKKVKMKNEEEFENDDYKKDR